MIGSIPENSGKGPDQLLRFSKNDRIVSWEFRKKTGIPRHQNRPCPQIIITISEGGCVNPASVQEKDPPGS
jgi:hypothetical protein